MYPQNPNLLQHHAPSTRTRHKHEKQCCFFSKRKQHTNNNNTLCGGLLDWKKKVQKKKTHKKMIEKKKRYTKKKTSSHELQFPNNTQKKNTFKKTQQKTRKKKTQCPANHVPPWATFFLLPPAQTPMPCFFFETPTNPICPRYYVWLCLWDRQDVEKRSGWGSFIYERCNELLRTVIQKLLPCSIGVDDTRSGMVGVKDGCGGARWL